MEETAQAITPEETIPAETALEGTTQETPQMGVWANLTPHGTFDSWTILWT